MGGINIGMGGINIDIGGAGVASLHKQDQEHIIKRFYYALLIGHPNVSSDRIPDLRWNLTG